MTSPTITPPEGHEIISSDIANQMPDKMKVWSKGEPKWTTFYKPTHLAKILGAGLDHENCIFSAPLGTTAALSTPLPEARRCNCKPDAPVHDVDCDCSSCCFQRSPHTSNCPQNPRNRLVHVLPGQLAEWKEKPEGLLYNNAQHVIPGGGWTNPYFADKPKAIHWFKRWLRNDNPGDFAYALPQWSYDEAMGRGEKVSCPCWSETGFQINRAIETEAERAEKNNRNNARMLTNTLLERDSARRQLSAALARAEQAERERDRKEEERAHAVQKALESFNAWDDLQRQLAESKARNETEIPVWQARAETYKQACDDAKAMLDAVRRELQADANFGVLVKQLFGDPLRAAEDEIESLRAQLAEVTRERDLNRQQWTADNLRNNEEIAGLYNQLSAALAAKAEAERKLRP